MENGEETTVMNTYQPTTDGKEPCRRCPCGQDGDRSMKKIGRGGVGWCDIRKNDTYRRFVAKSKLTTKFQLGHTC